jgi:hypothetical protein
MTSQQNEYVIFAELKRNYFDDIRQEVENRYTNVQYGSQGDDWIWLHYGDDKIEIDSFYSMELEMKGLKDKQDFADEILSWMKPEWIIARFEPPKIDMTR